MVQEISWSFGKYQMRKVIEEDFESYFNNLNPLDSEVARLTGSPKTFDKEKVRAYFSNNIGSEDRVDFMILDEQDKVIGECVLNDFDLDVQSSNLRIVIFDLKHTGQGIGEWAVCNALFHAFEILQMNRVSLDVFSFNTHAIRMYKKVGFKQEGILREAILDGDNYADDVLMAILASEWKDINK